MCQGYVHNHVVYWSLGAHAFNEGVLGRGDELEGVCMDLCVGLIWGLAEGPMTGVSLSLNGSVRVCMGWYGSV